MATFQTHLTHDSNTESVRLMYERHPYPHYPLLAKPRWQDGFLGSSLWADAVMGDHMRDFQRPAKFLSIGCGEILPYIIRQWEPSATRVTCVDLSQRSLRRAAFRTALLGRKIDYHRIDINEFLTSDANKNNTYSHIEAYGVLHHIPAHRATLLAARERLATNGIMRIMVYNSHSRDWIWQINRAFHDLQLSFYRDDDVRQARKILLGMAEVSPALAQRLEFMGRESLNHDTRFADTFMHPWECRTDINQWYAMFRECGLKPVALYDRYAELDDLPNPLWRCPTAEELTERARDRRFENNLEIWLTHLTAKPPRDTATAPQIPIPARLRLTMPPTQFKRFSETESLSFGVKLGLWQGLLRYAHRRTDPTAIRIIKGLDQSASGRLARIGIITPRMAEDAGLYERLLKPMHAAMTPPTVPDSDAALVAAKFDELTAPIPVAASKKSLARLRWLKMER
jgi:SAM-dependent methyltransferase